MTVFFGRLGTHLKIGIVGLPNVGKSSFFNILSKKAVPAENRPFCTIDPNNADVNIPDARFEKLVAIHKPASVVPAQLHVRDIAGLVRGAATGEGLGNAFLSHIGEVDGLIHMIRLFEGDEVSHVEGEIDPVRDLDIIFAELVQKDTQVVQGLIDKLSPIVSRGLDKAKAVDLEVLKKVKMELEAGRQVRCCQWSNKDTEFLNTLPLLTAKPALFLVNMSQRDFIRQRNKWLSKVKQWIDEQTGEELIPFSAQMEARVHEMSPEDAAQWLDSNSAKLMLPRIITAAYRTIRLIHFFTAGPDEVRCWTIRRGMKAPQAAGRIHTDMEKGFICAEVISWDDFEALGSVAKCRDEGRQRQEGRNYEVQDGDIILIRFNASKGGKK